MKVLLFTTYYENSYRTDLRCGTKAIHDFAKEWIKQGHEVTVVHTYIHYASNILKFKPGKYWKVQEPLVLDGVNIFLMETQFFVRKARGFGKVQKRIIKKNIHQFVENHSEYKPDVVLVHFPTHFEGILDELPYECPKIAVCHETDLETMRRRIKLVPKIQAKYTKMGARSFAQREKANKIGLDVAFVANSGIESGMIISDKAFENKWTSESREVLSVVCCGQLIPRKKVDTVIRAAADAYQNQPFKLLIVGDGKERENYEALAADCGITEQCIFTGNVPHEQVLEYMDAADIFVLVSEKETFGLVYLEAMARGCIVIGSRNDGIDGILVDGQNGYLVNAGDKEELEALLKKIASMSWEDRRRIAKNALLSARQLQSDNAARQYLNELK